MNKYGNYLKDKHCRCGSLILDASDTCQPCYFKLLKGSIYRETEAYKKQGESWFKEGNVSVNFKDEVGNTFGDLTVIELISRNSKCIWKCRCTCGKETEKSGPCLRQYLKRGLRIHCGDSVHTKVRLNSETSYPLAFNNSLKLRIRAMDENCCAICNKTEKENGRKLDVHHIDYNKQNCTEDNLLSLCQTCHVKTNYSRSYWQQICTEMVQALKWYGVRLCLN